jgi:carbonic anhydrase
MFASERANVLKAVEFTRHSPLIGPKIPVHGLMVDTATGKLEWVVNGYQALDSVASAKAAGVKLADESGDAMRSLAAFKIGEMKFPETKIGEIATYAKDWLSHEIQPAAPQIGEAAPIPPAPPVPPLTPKVPPIAMPVPPVVPKPRPPVPPRVRPAFNFPKGKN